MRSFSRFFAPLALLAAPPAVAQDFPTPDERTDRPAIALMGTVPIYWGEVGDMDELLRGEAEPHWARGMLETYAEPVALDYLSEEALAPFTMLLMAQPRGLTGEENVALDAWVRGGGRLLLFADPMMTGESRFGIGDRRRPQDVILLSPILTHWGLELWVDTEQAEGLTHFDPDGDNIPVNMFGAWISDDSKDDCAVRPGRLVARCQLGEGEALLLADAAMLDLYGPHPGAAEAFSALLRRIFPEFGDHAGNTLPISRESPENDGISASEGPETAHHGHGEEGF